MAERHKFPEHIELGEGETVSGFPLQVEPGTDLGTLIGTAVPVGPHGPIEDGQSFVFSKEKGLVGDTTHIMQRRGAVVARIEACVAAVGTFNDPTVSLQLPPTKKQEA